MTLCWLEVHNVRNIISAKITLGPQFNVFTGSNGAGKTSILEAVFFLSRGSSFRSHDLSRIINHQATSYHVIGCLNNNVTVGVEYGDAGFHSRVNGVSDVSRAELAKYLPLTFIGPDSHRLLTDGPQQRRKLVDWGAFHVEPQFLTVWRHYQRGLKQRNEALKSNHPVAPWDVGLVEWAYQLDLCRRRYINRLVPFIQSYVRDLMDVHDLNIEYFPGWRSEVGYDEILRRFLDQDQKLGHTRYGPHRADLHFRVGEQTARDVVSGGQQKLLVFSLLLAQVALLHSVGSLRCIVLVDDLASELDLPHQVKLLALLRSLDTQVLMASVDHERLLGLGAGDIRRFHVEHGKITEQAL